MTTHIAKIIVLAALVSLLLSGCQAFGSKQQSAIPDSSAAFKGKDGLVISFFEGAPPDKLFPQTVTDVALLLENKGALSISCVPNEDSSDQNYNPGGCGRFIVFAKEPFSLSKEGGLAEAVQDYDNKLIGKESYASGGRAAHTIPNIIVGNAAKTTSSYVFAAACYPYETTLSTPVCVDVASFTVEKKNKVCVTKDIRLTSQGAPVAITKIEQNKFVELDSNGKTIVLPQLRLFVQNAGAGIVIERSAQSFDKACTSEAISTGVDASILGKITVKNAEISGQKVTCNKGKAFTLTGRPEKDFIECVPEEGFVREEYQNNFVATFNMVLSYGYQSSASKNVLIEVLDEPPMITAFTLPKETDGKAELTVGVTATDDFGVSKIMLLGKDNELLQTYDGCNELIECKATFKIPSADLARLYMYNAQAVDTSGNPSRIKTGTGAITGPPDVQFIEFPKSAAAGADMQIKVAAIDNTWIKKIELLDADEKMIDTVDCTLDKKTCEASFTQKAPDTAGQAYTYKARATDGNSAQKTTDVQAGTTTAPAPAAN